MLLASTISHLLSHYMDPVETTSYFGYRVKPQYNHLLPEVYGRPKDYIYAPYNLPDYDEMYKKAMNELNRMEPNERSYDGCHNRSFQ